MKKLKYALIYFLIIMFFSQICSSQNLWKPKSKGLLIPNYTMNLFDVRDTFWLCTVLTLNKSTNYGEEWKQQTLGLITGAEDLAFKDSIIVLSITNGDYGSAVMKSTNSGQTWYNISKGLGDSVSLFHSTILIKDNYLFLGFTTAVMRCSMLGESEWELKSNYVGLESWKFPNPKKIRSFNKYLFIADNNNGVWASTDLGENWYSKNNGLSFMGVFDIQCFNDVLYASTYGGGICRSYDWGENWERITPKDSTNLNNVNTMFAKDNLILAGTFSNGLYISRDYGKTWQPEEISELQGLSSSGMGSIIEKNGYIYACFLKYGVYKIILSSLITSVKDEVWEPLINVYPNPASDKLLLKEIPDGAITYEIYNQLGIKVSGGEIANEINVAALPIGIYFLKIGNEKPIKFVKVE